jgi:hypothetical protein
MWRARVNQSEERELMAAERGGLWIILGDPPTGIDPSIAD